MHTFARIHRVVAFALGAAMIAACSGGGGGGFNPGPPPPTPTPTPTQTPPPFNQADFTCPTSDSPTSVARVSFGARSSSEYSSSESTPRQRPVKAQRGAYSPSLLAISYNLGYARMAAAQIGERETTMGARLTRQLVFDRLGMATRVVSVAPSKLVPMQASLRTQPGVRSVSRVGLRFPTIVTTPYFTNDPYFKGFAGTSAPFWEAPSIPGQWDMHAVGLEFAFGYSQPGNGSGLVNAGALGLSSTKLAIVDTGEDTGLTELHSKIAHQGCFITNPNNQQSTSAFTTDPQGHGTDVSGIALADINNGFGFAGNGGNVSLMGYRVFPTPDTNNCDNSLNDPTCGASTLDIASAINDAVANDVKVISISLGGTDASGNGCNPAGVDVDPTEGAAVANAIAHNVVVVAAAGNGIGSGSAAGQLDAPACDTGVIAAGATGLDDGQPNGTGAGGNAGGTAANPKLYVASYSQYGSHGGLHDPTAWGMVAPGGDPASSNDLDDLHWIENIWSSTAPDATDFCKTDFAGASGDCRILIAGTSMSTPHIAGAAALIISANGNYASPTKMKTLLCQTADQISDPKEGCGSLNVYRAMAMAVGDPVLP